ncbi:metal-sensing transcriptional repressor [Guptibacillus hwajinpoensis]|uniref:metal-sensing transcriptional repressor n=1 Tax=Guptibacillus hwajinpoensis TaxID=208199 RepID=UPI001CFCBA8D|nr:metal-sensing transcriptional repressor [Pseudalkalibacillus hwajinpoensis]WLR58145.1 metal-sensing transcriptional repressor [Pseudalkalibacillus hwajinpoensis]
MVLTDELNIPLQPDKKPTEPRTDEEKQQLQNRLKRIEGQIRGIQKMVSDDRYCVDILIQLSAIQAALKKVGYTLLERHTKTCVANSIQAGNGDEQIEELMKVIQQFSK